MQLYIIILCGKNITKQAVNKDITPSYFVQKKPFSCLIEEGTARVVKVPGEPASDLVRL